MDKSNGGPPVFPGKGRSRRGELPRVVCVNMNGMKEVCKRKGMCEIFTKLEYVGCWGNGPERVEFLRQQERRWKRVVGRL